MEIMNLNKKEKYALVEKLNKSEVINDFKFKYEETSVEINGELFFNVEEVNDYLYKEEVKLKVAVNKPMCACGEELIVIHHKGYYDKFAYLACENEVCNYLDNASVDKEESGGYV